VVNENSKPYPPKRILELATGVPTSQFWGGPPTNSVFQKFGFRVDRKDPRQDWNETVAKQTIEQAAVPDVNKLLDELFARQWANLHEDYKDLTDSQYPGVYVLAYPDGILLGRPIEEDLTGQSVKEGHIFYVGVSHAGVRGRLKQFIDGLEDGGHHSGAKKFFRKVAKGIRYTQLTNAKPFFVASISVPSIYEKEDRTPLDLQKMGIVAALEWYALARIKREFPEPWLNTK
jgi:hypothetical protein